MTDTSKRLIWLAVFITLVAAIGDIGVYELMALLVIYLVLYFTGLALNRRNRQRKR